MEEEGRRRWTHDVVLVSNPAFSHQVSILEFAKRLLHLHPYLHVTCLIPTLPTSPKSKPLFFRTLPPNITCLFLPPVNFDDLTHQNITLETQLQLAVSRSMPTIRQTLTSLINSTDGTKLVALIADAFAHEALQFGNELNVLSYIYFPCSAMLLSLCLFSSTLDQTVSSEYRDYPQPIHIPGCVSVRGVDLPNSVQDRSSLAYKLYLHRCQRYRLAHGIILNSFMEMETDAIRAAGEIGPPVYPIGPVTQTGPIDRENGGLEYYLEWLDKQPADSVVYVSFGSGGTLPHEQINELSLGLELSGIRFLWVNVRPPNDRATATYLTHGSPSVDDDDPLYFLPSGFQQRSKGRGLVTCGWAPQLQILGHASVGGFLTHCGWNSILESVVKGVPMIAWPLFAEQRTNAALLTDGLQVAVRPKSSTNGIVLKDEIANVLKTLMEDQHIRSKIKDLQHFAASAVTEHGSSTNSLSMLARNWKSFQT